MAALRLKVLAAAVVVLAAAGCGAFEFQEATVDAIQLGFRNGSLTSAALVRFYLDQIARLNPLLHAVIEVNPDALAQAARADAERRASGGGACGGPMHGVPVLLKDNIATRDRLNTTAGSFALLGSVVPRDAGVVACLRRAGAVILGKANLNEWANFRGVDAGWSARGGQTLESVCSLGHAMRVELRVGRGGGGEHGRRDAGIGDRRLDTLPVVVELCGWHQADGWADEPVRRHPNHAEAKHYRPMCRTVSDAVHVLDAIVGYDKLDAEATGAASKYIPRGGYTQFLRVDGLRGKRIGVPTVFFRGYDKVQLAKHGAIVIKDLDISTNFTDLDDKETLLNFAEFKLSINAYLSDLLRSPVRSLSDIIAFNNKHPVEERLKDFGQANFIAAEKTNGIGTRERAAIRRLKEISANGLEKLMKEHRLDAIVVPTNRDAVSVLAISVLAVGGYPGIAVPAGYDKEGVPIGICFGGLRGYEPRLIEMAYAFEQATKLRRPPTFKR
ncbi:unnamed protein product [Urochloa decumbens]|uniref:Amidase domain-containing protein n=1 Tax=Urochloa decumbens TaxID=240449 RepID=A0ABC9E7R3_9POAL